MNEATTSEAEIARALVSIDPLGAGVSEDGGDARSETRYQVLARVTPNMQAVAPDDLLLIGSDRFAVIGRLDYRRGFLAFEVSTRRDVQEVIADDET